MLLLNFAKIWNMKYLSFTLFFCFLLQISLTGSASERATNKTQTFENVCYKVAEDGDSLLLDISLPHSNQSSQKFPVLIMIHGGAWIQGDKDVAGYYYMKHQRELSLENGFAVISINYRLLNNGVHFPAPMKDCKDAVRWVRANASVYGLDTGNIGLIGESAGAHLALLVADSPDSLWQGSVALSKHSSRVKYVIDNFGPVDLNQLFKTDAGGVTIFFFKTFLHKLYDIRNELILGMTTEDFKQNKQPAIAALHRYSPLTYISSKSVPTLIYHGTKDRVVPYKQSKMLLRILRKNKVESKFVTVKKGNHGFTNIPQEQVDALVTRNINFMKAHTKQNIPADAVLESKK